MLSTYISLFREICSLSIDTKFADQFADRHSCKTLLNMIPNSGYSIGWFLIDLCMEIPSDFLMIPVYRVFQNMSLSSSWRLRSFVFSQTYTNCSSWHQFTGNKSGGPASHQVSFLWGPAEIYTVPVRMSDTIFRHTLKLVRGRRREVGRFKN